MAFHPWLSEYASSRNSECAFPECQLRPHKGWCCHCIPCPGLRAVASGASTCLGRWWGEQPPYGRWGHSESCGFCHGNPVPDMSGHCLPSVYRGAGTWPPSAPYVQQTAVSGMEIPDASFCHEFQEQVLFRLPLQAPEVC